MKRYSLPVRSTWLLSLLFFMAYGTFSKNIYAQSILEEVVVTAQKREQSLQDVSLSVTAFSGEMIEDLGFQEATSIVAQSPNVLFRTTGPLPTFTIRGVTLIDVGDGNEPPVGFYIDEVYRGTAAGQGNQLYDLERVEVLRGPQGTLFGRNTTGGLIHFITRKPTEEFEANFNFQYGSFDQRIVDGAISGAFSDKVRARVSFKYNEDDGWQDNVSNGADFAVTDTIAGRAQLEVDVTGDLTALFSVSASEQNNSHAGYAYAGLFDPTTFGTCTLNAVNSGQCINAFGVNDPDPDPEHIFSDETELLIRRYRLARLARLVRPALPPRCLRRCRQQRCWSRQSRTPATTVRRQLQGRGNEMNVGQSWSQRTAKLRVGA